MTPAEPWAHLYEDVKVQIPGLLDAVQAQVTFVLFKDFCDMTNIWQEEVPVAVTPYVTSYEFSVGNFGAPNRLLLMYDPTMSNPNRQWVQGNVQMPQPGVLTINYAPSTETVWNAVIAKTPLERGEDRYPRIDPCDYWILDKYRDALTAGVLARHQMMPGKPYSNEKGGLRNNQYYISQRSKARVDVLHAHTYGGQRWSYPQGYATVRRGGWA